MKECQNIEWKETWNDDYLKWVCAFANSEGGSICIGIDDKGNVSPLKNEKKLLMDLPKRFVMSSVSLPMSNSFRQIKVITCALMFRLIPT